MAKRILDEELRFSVIVNGNKAQKELYDLEKSTRKLNATNKELRAEKAKLFSQGKRNTDEYKRLTAEIKANSTVITANKQRMSSLQKEIGLTGLTMAQLRKRAAQLRIQLNHTIPNGAAYKRYNAELLQINQRMAQLRMGAKKTKFSLSSLAQGFNKYAVLGASALAGITGIVVGVQKLIDYNGKLSDSQADVMKTTGMTKEEVDDLTKSFGLLKTRTSRIDLLKIAEEGGRIGVVKEEIGAFVEVMNKANVALGDTFQGGVSEVAAKLGKLKFLFKETKDLGVDKAYNAIGSSLNELGANGIATEANIAAFATRVGALPDALKPAIHEALGLGAAFDESGIMVEKAGRAYEIFISKAATSTDKFAKQMNLSEQEVKDLINTNPTEFFLQFAESLSGVNEDGVEMSNILKDLGLNASAVKGIVGAAANNTQKFRDKIALSNKAMLQGNSLINEYNIKNNNLAATLAKIKKTAAGWFSSKGLIDFLSAAAKGIATLIGATEKYSVTLKKQHTRLGMLELQLKDVNTSQSQRVKIIKQLQSEYDTFLPNLDAEKISNEQLSEAMRLVNEQMINKIVLQKKQEELEKYQEKAGESKYNAIEQEALIRKQITFLKKQFKSAKIDIGYGTDIFKQATIAINSISEEYDIFNNKTGNIIPSVSKLMKLVDNLKNYQKDYSENLKFSNQLEEERNKLAEQFGLNIKKTESTKTEDTSKKEYKYKKYNSTTNKLNELKHQQAELLDLHRQFEDNKIALLDAGYEKEKAKVELIHQRRLADLKAKKYSEGEISKSSDKATLLQHNKIIDELIEQEESIHKTRLATIQEKAAKNEILKLKEQYNREKTVRQTNFNNQLSEITTLSEAKALLKDSLSQKELSQINDLETAKQKLRDKYNQEEAKKESEHLKEIVNLLQSAVNDMTVNGIDFTLLTPEQEKEIKAQIERIKLKISELKNVASKKSSSQDENDAGDMESVDFGDVDILGFTPQQWDELFSNLEEGKLGVEAISMALSALGNLWQKYNQYVEAGENRQLAKYEQNADRRKQILQRQLDHGQISQEEYANRVSKIDTQLDRQKQEIEYQQAKRQRDAALIQIAISTAQAIMSIWAQVPKFDFGISAGILTGVVTALGALQAVTILRQPLPARGHEEGLYPIQREQDGKIFNARFGGTTTSGMVTEPTYFLTGEAGPEMIIDSAAYRQMDPEIRGAMHREVARVKGFESGYYNETLTTPEYNQSNTSISNELLQAVLINLQENNELLLDLRVNGIEAKVTNKDYKSMKNLQEGIDKYNTMRTKNKM